MTEESQPVTTPAIGWVRQTGRFGVVGILSTAVHFVTALIALDLFGASLIPANVAGFTVALVFSYVMHSLWTFQQRLSGRTAVRFAINAGACFLLTVAIAAIAESFGLHKYLGQAIVITVVPVLSFLAHRFISFR